MEMVKKANEMKKTTGLAAFSEKSKKEQQSNLQGKDAIRSRERGKGDKVALTIRLSKSDWERVHQLAVSEDVSIQALAVDGLSKVFSEKGLPKIGS